MGPAPQSGRTDQKKLSLNFASAQKSLMELVTKPAKAKEIGFPGAEAERSRPRSGKETPKEKPEERAKLLNHVPIPGLVLFRPGAIARAEAADLRCCRLVFRGEGGPVWRGFQRKEGARSYPGGA